GYALRIGDQARGARGRGRATLTAAADLARRRWPCYCPSRSDPSRNGRQPPMSAITSPPPPSEAMLAHLASIEAQARDLATLLAVAGDELPPEVTEAVRRTLARADRHLRLLADAVSNAGPV